MPGNTGGDLGLREPVHETTTDSRTGEDDGGDIGRRWRYYVSRAALTGRKQEAGSVFRIPASEIENRIARAVGTHLAVQASAIDDCHINYGVLGGNQAIPQHQQTRRLRRNKPTENDARNAIERATAGATRIEILLSELVVAEGQDRALTLPWTRPSSRWSGKRNFAG